MTFLYKPIGFRLMIDVDKICAMHVVKGGRKKCLGFYGEKPHIYYKWHWFSRPHRTRHFSWVGTYWEDTIIYIRFGGEPPLQLKSSKIRNGMKIHAELLEHWKSRQQ